MTEQKKKTATSQPQSISDLSLDGEIVRVRAYQLYEQRGKEDGHDLDDWLRAEEELRQPSHARAA